MFAVKMLTEKNAGSKELTVDLFDTEKPTVNIILNDKRLNIFLLKWIMY